MSNIVQYKAFDLDTLNDIDRQVKDISSSNYLELAQGDTIVRVLPAVGRESPFRVTAMHYIEALPGSDKRIIFACPRVESRSPCIACQKCEELSRTGNPLDRDRAGKMQAKLTVYCNVIDRADPTASVKVWRFGNMIWKQLKQIRSNVRSGGDFTDPTANGFDLIVNKEGEGKEGTKYTVTADRQSSPLSPDEGLVNEILASAIDLDSMVNAAPPEELFAAWGMSMRTMASPAAAVAAQRAINTSPRQLSPGVGSMLPAGGAGTGGSSVMQQLRQNKAQQAPVAAGVVSPSRNAVQDAEGDDDDSSWLDK